MAGVIKGSHSFTCHSVTRVFTSGLIHIWLSSTATEHHRTLPTEGRRLSLPEWLVTNRGGLPAHRWLPIPFLTGLGVE